MVTLPCGGMEVKEVQRVVVSRPVASRPSCPGFTTTYTELLAGAIDASSPRASPEIMTTTFAVRPKTVKLKPSVNHFPVGGVQFQAAGAATTATAAGPSSSGKDSKAEERPNVVYKPLAKLVSRATVPLLANMGNFDQNRSTPTCHGAPKSTELQLDKEPEIASLEPALQNADQHNTTTPPPADGDRVSFDGYNWRKYGQKQVKGSEYPRSYYKCTHPNCPVKKKVERSLDGKIAEIVYKGEHNHPKLQPPKRTSPQGQGQPHVSDGPGRDSCNAQSSDFRGKKNNENYGKMGKPESASWGNTHRNLRKVSLSHDPVKNPHNTGSASHDNSCGLSEECEMRNRGEDGNDEEPASKRRRKVKKITEIGVEQDPQALVQSNAEPEILDDGYRWRKYGQKVVKRNPHPRSYYRCTNLKCNVRKHVERSSTDSSAFVTTYEGKHNHEMPGTRSSNIDVSDSDAQAQ